MGKKIYKQNSSFGVLRANPRISGNVKISTDSRGDIWLNSIDSNNEMSKSKYKAFRISPDSNYALDLYNFFDKGETPSDFVFGIRSEISDQKTQTNDPDLIYEFSYSMGVEPLVSDKYDEDFKYLAPLWIGDDIPEYFVIFRISDPIDYSYSIPVQFLEANKTYKVVQSIEANTNDPGFIPYSISVREKTYTDGQTFVADANSSFTVNGGIGEVILLDPLFNLGKIENVGDHFLEKILPKATAIATFDMTENSKIGRYLRNIKNSRGFSDSMINVKFEDNLLTTYNGVNYQRGIFDKKGEYFYDYCTVPKSQIEFEEYVTNGFSRNGILSTKLLNLEFFFNDDQSDIFTINRYFGLYVNSLDLGNFKIDGNSLYEDGGASGNSPVPAMNNKGYSNSSEDFYQYNKEGVRIFIAPKEISGFIPNSQDTNITEDSKLFYIMDKNKRFYSLKRDPDYSQNSPTSHYSSYGITGYENQLVLQNTRVNLGNFSGADKKTKKQYSASQTGEKGRAHFVIRIEKELSNFTPDSFIFYHPLGKYGGPGMRYDIFKASDMSSIIDEWGPGSFYSQSEVYYFHPFGSGSDIARSLSGLVNSMNFNSFEAFSEGNEVVIRVKATGSRQNSLYGFDFYQDFSSLTRMPDSRKGVIFFNDEDVSDINSSRGFIGGSDYPMIRTKVKIEDSRKIIPGNTYIETDFGGSLVSGVYRFVDQYVEKDGDILGLKDFKTHATIELTDISHKISFGEGLISAYELFSIPLGVFSFLGLREADCDFWSSDYGYTPTEEYYKYMDIQPDGKTPIIPGISYFVSPGAIIKYDGVQIQGPLYFTGVTSVDSYEIIQRSSNFEVDVIPERFALKSGGETIIYPDLDKFPGFYGIQEFRFYDDSIFLNRKSDQMFSGKLSSEYDYTKDNYLKENALKSRTIPYISKWVYNEGTDARGNGYRLNTNPAFSPLNFSPSFFRRSQDPKYFTHEWYTLQLPPELLPESNLNYDKSYGSSILDISMLKNADPNIHDYFTDYFIKEGEDYLSIYPESTTIKNVNITERFGFIKFNDESRFCEVLFRGVKVKFKRRIENFTGEQGARFFTDDKFFDGYKFSSILKVIDNIPGEIQPPVKFRIIENRTFKTITFIVEVLVDELRNKNIKVGSPEENGVLDYFLLYSLQDKLSLSDYSPFTQTPVIGDVKLSCALNITSNSNNSGFISNVNSGTPLDNGKVYIIPNPEYETDLREEIRLVYPTTTTSSFPKDSPGSFYGIPSTSGTYSLPWATGVQKDVLNFTSTDSSYNFEFSSLGFPGTSTVPVAAFFGTVSKIPIYQIGGGEGYMKGLFEKISFASIAIQVNSEDPYIEYISTIWDSNISETVELRDQFNIEFIRPSLIEQNSYIIPRLDTNKPPELNVKDIGYVLDSIRSKNEIYRYSGGYNLLFRDVLMFENVKGDSILSYSPDQTEYSLYIDTKTQDNPSYDKGSNNCYFIDGVEAPILNLIKGNTYYFDLSDSSNLNNNLYFSPDTSESSQSSIDYGYSIYGTPGTPNSYVSLYVGDRLPSVLYYRSDLDKFMGGKINIAENLSFKNTSFGPYKNGFGKVKNVNYNKYSRNYIFSISQNSPYSLVYPLVNETPIDKRDLSAFISTWDPGFIREYVDPSSFNPLPGTRTMKESKSFLGSKIMKTPNIFSQGKQILNPNSIPDILNQDPSNFPNYEVLYEETDTEIRGIIMLDRILIRYFNENGADRIFKNTIVPEFGFGSQSTVSDDVEKYISENVIYTYEAKELKAYVKRTPINRSTEEYAPVVTDLADYQKIINGYLPTQDARFVKRTEMIYEFYFSKDPSFDYSVSFGIQIGKI